MQNQWAKQAAANREDLSQYLVHLTRDNKNHFPLTGKNAYQTFSNILEQKQIKARRVLCMHMNEVTKEPPHVRERFKVACFTETPLTQIKHFVGVYRKQYQFAAYGFIFKKETLLEKGASPALYINQYGSVNLRHAADTMYKQAKLNRFRGQDWHLLPFMNSVHDGNDFDWEREWKIRGNVSFLYRELVGVIMPERGTLKLRQRVERFGVPVIAAGWDADRIEETLASRPRIRPPVKPKRLVLAR